MKDEYSFWLYQLASWNPQLIADHAIRFVSASWFPKWRQLQPHDYSATLKTGHKKQDSFTKGSYIFLSQHFKFGFIVNHFLYVQGHF